MKKVILAGVLGVLLFGYLTIINQAPRAWADVASLNADTGHQAYIWQYMNCTVSGGVAVQGTCSPVGVNWGSLIGYMETNINWQDLPGVTGAPTSAATWLKSTAP